MIITFDTDKMTVTAEGFGEPIQAKNLNEAMQVIEAAANEAVGGAEGAAPTPAAAMPEEAPMAPRGGKMQMREEEQAMMKSYGKPRR